MPPMAGILVETIIRILDRFTPSATPTQHLETGTRGEDEAYFFLRRRGYQVVARNWRPIRGKGEIDLVAWDHDILCFVEVKTRTSRKVKPAEAAVDDRKRQMLHRTAGQYMRRLRSRPRFRYDVVSVYFSDAGTLQDIEHFQGAFSGSNLAHSF